MARCNLVLFTLCLSCSIAHSDEDFRQQLLKCFSSETSGVLVGWAIEMYDATNAEDGVSLNSAPDSLLLFRAWKRLGNASDSRLRSNSFGEYFRGRTNAPVPHSWITNIEKFIEGKSSSTLEQNTLLNEESVGFDFGQQIEIERNGAAISISSDRFYYDSNDQTIYSKDRSVRFRAEEIYRELGANGTFDRLRVASNHRQTVVVVYSTLNGPPSHFSFSRTDGSLLWQQKGLGEGVPPNPTADPVTPVIQIAVVENSVFIFGSGRTPYAECFALDSGKPRFRFTVRNWNWQDTFGAKRKIRRELDEFGIVEQGVLP